MSLTPSEVREPAQYSCGCQAANPAFSWDDHQHDPSEGEMRGCGSDSRCSCINLVSVLWASCDDCQAGTHSFFATPCDD